MTSKLGPGEQEQPICEVAPGGALLVLSSILKRLMGGQSEDLAKFVELDLQFMLGEK